MENLSALELALADPRATEGLAAQRLTDPQRRSTPLQACPPGADPASEREATLLIDELQHTQRWEAWSQAVAGLQDLNRRRQYPIVFFMNMGPDIIEAQDMFCDGGSRRLNDYLLSVVGHDTPAVSAYDEIGQYRPSEMPLARGHSLGNTNRAKADVLFEYVKPMLEQERAARDR